MFVKVYWDGGVVVTENDVLFIERGLEINPANVVDGKYMYSLDDYPCTPNWEWWMIVKKSGDTTLLTLDNGGIKFCNKEDLPFVMALNEGWIPVLYFRDGVMTRTPALLSSYVALTSDNLSIVDVNRMKNHNLRQHVNDETIHGANIDVLDLPAVLSKTVFVDDDVNVLFELIALAENRAAAIRTQGWGIGLIGVDDSNEISDLDLINYAGTGAYAKGENYDIVLRNGTLVSQNGSVNMGKQDRPVTVNVYSRAKPGLIA